MLQPPPPHMSMQDQHIALPAASVSFARRRATRQLGSVKGKPADIMISPRDATADRLAPSIQSAPPIPRAGPTQGMTGRFSSMALPSLPPVLGQGTQRLTVSRVPPTPTRLSMARNPPVGGPSVLTPTVASISTTAAVAAANAARSPPTANVPIASTLVPPTPAALHTPGHAGPPGAAKAAFLAPFETFYDALADARTLKHWLAEQLQKSQALAAQLQRQTEHVEALVSAAVERRMAPVRDEVIGLQRRVDELEAALGHASGGGGAPAAASGLVRTTSSNAHHAHTHSHTHPHPHSHPHPHGQTYSPNMGTATVAHKGKGKANGVPESYQFPPVTRRGLSPERESRSFPGSQTGSPVPFDVGRRLSVSAIRLDPRGAPPVGEASPHRSTGGASRERERERDREKDRERERERDSGLGGRALPPPPSAAPASAGAGAAGSGGWGRPWSPRGTRVSLPAGTSSARSSLVDRPGIARRASAQRVQGEGYVYPGHEGGEERGRGREREASSPPPPPRRDARSPDSMEE